METPQGIIHRALTDVRVDFREYVPPTGEVERSKPNYCNYEPL